MDRRYHPRVAVAIDARLTDLTLEGQQFDGRITDVSEGGVCIFLNTQLPTGDLVRVDFSDGTLFGQLMYSSSEGPPYRMGIDIFQVLTGASDLGRLVERSLRVQRPTPRPAVTATLSM